MTPKPDARPSLLAELLLYHSVLGRGYISPFPVTKGLVFTSSLPQEALFALGRAEGMFRKWHEESIEEDQKLLAALERDAGGPMDQVTGGPNRVKELKAKLSRRPCVTWKEGQVLTSTLVELMKTHYYGALTYLDPIGARLAVALGHSARLANDLGWYTLTEGTTDEAFIRSSGTGGANIHTLAGSDPIFNYYCSCMESHVNKLRDKIKNTTGGHVGIGRCVLIPGRPSIFSGTTAETLYSLLTRVYTLGDKPPEERVKVVFAQDSDAGWREFFSWNLPQLLNEDVPSAWQWKLADCSPTSPRLAVLFAARAALVGAFLEVAKSSPNAAIRQVEMTTEHLEIAQAMARMLYAGACGKEGFEKRIGNLKGGQASYLTPQRIAIAKASIEEAIKASDNLRVSRNQVRREVDGATLGCLDELVKRGDLVELQGTEECQMGKVRLAYCLPKDAPRMGEEDAFDEFDEAIEKHAENPKETPDSLAISVAMRLREHATETFNEHYAPVVSLSRMTRQELRALPRVLEMYPESFLMRGRGQELEEPPEVIADTDMPVDRDGANLWVRCRPTGEDFCDWGKASMLQLRQWAKDDGGEQTQPKVVPA